MLLYRYHLEIPRPGLLVQRHRQPQFLSLWYLPLVLSYVSDSRHRSDVGAQHRHITVQIRVRMRPGLRHSSIGCFSIFSLPYSSVCA